MKTHDELIQGSPAWHAHRATHFNASDAPAMMGFSPYKTRTQLLHELHTGLTQDVDAATQRRFDDGHRFEALARPVAEGFIGMELYPVTGSEGKLSASFDGLTMCETIGFEHKTLNSDLRECMEGEDEAGRLPAQYRVQMEQQLMVSGAGRILFMASKWSDDDLVEERHCWYGPDLALRQQIIDGWKQFADDLASYVPSEIVAEVVGRTPETLPALTIIMKGEVSASNLEEFKHVALTAIRSVNRDLKTDQDFADSAKARRWCEDIETRVAAAKDHALGQTRTIDDLFRTMDEISAEARDVRLALEKLEKARKESRRGEIVADGIKALADHASALNSRLGRPYLPAMACDFGGAIKGLRTFDSMQNAVNTALANAKISANATADKIQTNLNTLRELAAAHAFLFADTAQIVLKAPDDLTILVKSRISEHQAAEEKKAEQLRESIRKEEQEKAEKAVREAQEAEDSLIAGIWAQVRRIEGDRSAYIQKAISHFESGPADFANDPRQRVAEAVAAARQEMAAKLTAATERELAAAEAAKASDEAIFKAQEFASKPALAPVVIAPIATEKVAVKAQVCDSVQVVNSGKQAASAPPDLRLGQITERLGFALTADFLRTLGFEPAGRDRAAVLYHEADFQRICAALVKRINSACELLAA